MIIMKGTDMETKLYKYKLVNTSEVANSRKLPQSVIDKEFYVSSNIAEGQCVTWIYDNRLSHRTSIVLKVTKSKKTGTITICTEDATYIITRVKES